MFERQYSDYRIIRGLQSFDVEITKKYFYGFCRKAYAVFDYKYQLSRKVGLDFYSLAHEYYIQLLTHGFHQLEDRPEHMKLSTWMMGGFKFVVLDALKAFNKEFESLSEACSDEVLDYIRSDEYDKDMLFDVAEAVGAYYADRVMAEIAHMIIYLGYKQKDVAEKLGMTPSAVNQRYKRMMDDVVTPFVVEHYGGGMFGGIYAVDEMMGAMVEEEKCMARNMYIERERYEDRMPKPCVIGNLLKSVSNNINTFFKKNKGEENVMEQITSQGEISKDNKGNMENTRITSRFIRSLGPNEIFVFGSNLHGMHAGGAARTAYLNFGAEMGNGVGMQGRSYAIPTMQGGTDTIKPYVDDFIKYAKQHPSQTFLVTPIGCGIAGFEPKDIAPLFVEAKDVVNIHLPKEFWEILEK